MKRCRVLNLGLVEYGEAWRIQKQLFSARSRDDIIDTLIILQHPPAYTFGRRTINRQLLSDEAFMLNRNTKDNANPPYPPFFKEGDTLPPFSKGGQGGFLGETFINHRNTNYGIPCFDVDRGGGATYHGPGQIVLYPIIGIKSYTHDYHVYLRMLEDVIIKTLSRFMITGERFKGFTGVWVNGEKIASIGVRIIRGITMHGFSLNVNNNLKPFDYIIPCNIENVKITSMSKMLGRVLNLSKIEETLIDNFAIVFDMVLENRRFVKFA